MRVGTAIADGPHIHRHHIGVFTRVRLRFYPQRLITGEAGWHRWMLSGGWGRGGQGGDRVSERPLSCAGQGHAPREVMFITLATSLTYSSKVGVSEQAMCRVRVKVQDPVPNTAMTAWATSAFLGCDAGYAYELWA